MINLNNIYPAILSLLLLTLNSCQKNQIEEIKNENTETPKETQVVAEVKYDDLGYDKGLFTKDDKPFTGTSIRNHSNGKIGARYQFVDGIFDGVIEEWYENGQRSAYKMYKEGMRHGITTYWDEEGKPTKQVLYENDEEVEVKTGDQIPEDLGI